MSHFNKSLDSTQLAATTRLFSATVVQEIAKKGRSPLFSDLIKTSGLINSIDTSEPIRNIFDSAFQILKRKAYRNEYAYKAAITHKLLLGTHSLKSASMLTEFRVGNSKADVAILNGTSTVYEIKSERDNLDRLQSQITSYRNVFAKVNVITGKNHADAVLRTTPKEIGVLVLSDQFRISSCREAVDCSDRVDPVTIFESIHKIEAIKILRYLDKEIPEVPNTRLHQSLRALFKDVDPIQMHSCMLRVLKETRTLLPMSDFIESLPKSLQAAALSTPLRKQDRLKLLSALDTSIYEAMTWA